jgi:hypothetical protein
LHVLQSLRQVLPHMWQVEPPSHWSDEGLTA